MDDDTSMPLPSWLDCKKINERMEEKGLTKAEARQELFEEDDE